MKIITQIILVTTIIWATPSVSEVKMLDTNASKQQIRDAFYGNKDNEKIKTRDISIPSDTSRGISDDTRGVMIYSDSGDNLKFSSTTKEISPNNKTTLKKYTPTKKISPKKQHTKKNTNKKRYDNGIASEIQFKYNSTELLSGSKKFINNVAEVIAEKPEVKFIIEGHTDASGDELLNYHLSENRAETIKYILIAEYNISANRITTVGKGESSFKFSPNDHRNRRVEIKPLN